MKGVSVTVDDSEVRRKMEQVVSATNNLPFDKVAEALMKLVRGSFDQQRSPWGQKWEPWKHPKDIRKARLKKGNFSTKMLIDSSAMYDSIEESHDKSSVTVEAGEKAAQAYTAAQQFGTDHMEARPFFPSRSPDDVTFPTDWLDLVFGPIISAMQEAANK